MYFFAFKCTNVLKRKLFRKNDFPYDLPKGTEHYVMWYTFFRKKNIIYCITHSLIHVCELCPTPPNKDFRPLAQVFNSTELKNKEFWTSYTESLLGGGYTIQKICLIVFSPFFLSRYTLRDDVPAAEIDEDIESAIRNLIQSELFEYVWYNTLLFFFSSQHKSNGRGCVF